jgi:hypothetical protein
MVLELKCDSNKIISYILHKAFDNGEDSDKVYFVNLNAMNKDELQSVSSP